MKTGKWSDISLIAMPGISRLFEPVENISFNKVFEFFHALVDVLHILPRCQLACPPMFCYDCFNLFGVMLNSQSTKIRNFSKFSS